MIFTKLMADNIFHCNAMLKVDQLDAYLHKEKHEPKTTDQK